MGPTRVVRARGHDSGSFVSDSNWIQKDEWVIRKKWPARSPNSRRRLKQRRTVFVGGMRRANPRFRRQNVSDDTESHRKRTSWCGQRRRNCEAVESLYERTFLCGWPTNEKELVYEELFVTSLIGAEEKNFYKTGPTGDWTQGLPHAKRMWYHYTMSPMRSVHFDKHI